MSSAVFAGCASVPAAETSNAKIAVVPATVNFNEVAVGQQNAETVKITNTTSDSVSLDSLKVSGKGFSLAGIKAPLTLAPGASAHVTVLYTASSAAQTTGALEIHTEGLPAALSVPLEGSGSTAAALQISPNSLNFGQVQLKTTATLNATLKNTGNAKLKIAALKLPATGYVVTGLSSGQTLSSGQSIQFSVTFQPTVVGTVSSSLAVSAQGVATPASLSLLASGTTSSSKPPTSTNGGSTGVTAPAAPSDVAHSVNLHWSSSTSSVAGYHVYRGALSGGPYNRLDASTITALGFSDTTVQAGGHYFYVVTSQDPEGHESAFSNEASVEIPNP